MKKKNAILIADTRPALIGNLLVQLNETNKGLFEEAIIYYESINEQDKLVMQKIMPCKFIKFEYQLPNNVKKMSAFSKFSSLMFARYYMFDLLKEYQTITWIDTDVLICGDISPIIEKSKKSGMTANFEDPENKSYLYTDIVQTSFSQPIKKYNMNLYNMSSGLITVSDQLKNYDKMTKWCFDKTIEFADHLILPDQGILNILIQEFQIDVESLGEKGAYCFYPSYNRDSSKAKVIHAWGARKFWKSWYLYNKYPKWKEYYAKWLELGGSDIFGQIKPEVSVVIPMYKPNLEYFSLLLEDLLINQKQDHGFQYDNFELVLVVDGNDNDELIELVESYDDPRIRMIINKSRAGISRSLNMGIKSALADYIARIDDDDRVDEKRIYKQVNYLDKHSDIELVTTDFAYFGDMSENRRSFEGEMARAWSIFTCPFNHPTIMFRKKFFMENNLYYDENRGCVEDWELWLRCFEKGMRVGNIPEILYFHRWHSGSAGQSQKTVDMMRELVKNNFMKLNIELNSEDLKIVPPWQGKVSKEQYKHLKSIFNQAVINNRKIKKYDEQCLIKAFDLRLFEAKNGYIKGIVFKNTNKKGLEEKTLKQKMVGPIYKPIKRVFYNINAEAVNDNLNNFLTPFITKVKLLLNQESIKQKSINNKHFEEIKNYIHEEIEMIEELKLEVSNLKNEINNLTAKTSNSEKRD